LLRPALHNDLENYFKDGQQWNLRFDVSKGKHLHFGAPTTIVVTISINGILIDIISTHKDLCIVFDDQLKFHSHMTQFITNHKSNWLMKQTNELV